MKVLDKIKWKAAIDNAKLEQRHTDEKEFSERLRAELNNQRDEFKHDLQVEIERTKKDMQIKIDNLLIRLNDSEKDRLNLKTKYNKVYEHKLEMLAIKERLKPLVNQFLTNCGGITHEFNEIDLIDYKMKPKKIEE